MKILALSLFAMLSQFALAQGVPPPNSRYGDDPCNMTYEGSYNRLPSMPLVISLDRIQGSNRIYVTLVLGDEVFRGEGRCDFDHVEFDLRRGWFHTGYFYWGRNDNYVRSLRGTQWVDGRPYQDFAVFPRERR